MSDEEQSDFAHKDNRGSLPGRSQLESVPAGTRTFTGGKEPDGPVGNDRNPSVSESSSTESRVVGLNAFRPYPVGVGGSQFSAPRPSGTSTGFDESSTVASSNLEYFNSGRSAGVVDERIRKRIEEEKENDDHWAPGGQEGDGTELVLDGNGIGHGEVDGNQVSHPDMPPGTRRSAGPSGSEGGIGHTLKGTNTCLEPSLGASDGDWARGNLRRLDSGSTSLAAEEGSAIAELERQVDGNLSRLDFDSGGDTDAYLLTEMEANHKQRDLLDEKVKQAPEMIQTPYRHKIIHLLHCAQIYWTDAWHEMHSENVLIDKLPGGSALKKISGGTSRLWDFEESVVQSRNGGEYYRPDTPGPGRTREYRIDPMFAIRFWQLAGEGDANYKLHEEGGTANKRARGSAALKTKFRDGTGHRWGEEQDLPGGHYSLLEGALRILSDATHKIDVSAITEMKEILKEEWEEAKSQLGQAKREYDRLNYIDEEGGARTEMEAAAIREARSSFKDAQTRKEKAEGRYHALLSGLEVISRQADRIEGGIAYVQNAYEVQPVSGRLSFRRGGPQGLPAVLKSFAYSREDVYNYDIKSSQTTGLRQLAEDLRRVGYDVDTEALDTYIDRGGKDWVVENYDLPRSLVKRVEHAIKFGAKIPGSMKQAYHQKENAVWGMPEIAEHIEDYFSSREEQERALENLREIFGPQVQMIENLAEGLLTDYWNEHSYAGGRGKGRVMTNHCGITFCKYDHEGGHEARSKAMAWYLQGLEAAYVHALTILSEEYDYEVMANEHDGLITVGTIPQKARDRARELSGARRAELTDKRFEHEAKVQEVAKALGRDMPHPPLEPTPTPCKTTPCNTNDETIPARAPANPGGDEPSKRPENGSGSGVTTSHLASSPPAKSESNSKNAPRADGGPNGSTSGRGARPASDATERREEKISDEELEELLGGGGETSDEWACH
jgi:hypothetical protein